MGSISRLLEKINPDESLAETLLVLIYEVGDLAKCIQRMSFDKENTVGYKAEARKSLADIITQVRLLCERLGFSFEGLKISGEEEMRSKIKWR